MKHLYNYCVAVIALSCFYGSVQSQPCADSTNIVVFQYDNRNYEVVKELRTWSDAASCAVERGGWLVHIETQEEQDSVYNGILNVAQVSPTYTTSYQGGGIAYVWTGGTDSGTEGTWLWDGDNDGVGDVFWIGQGSNGTNNGATQNGLFANFGGKSAGGETEPDNYGDGQDGLGIGMNPWPYPWGGLGIGGEWNDVHTVQNQFYYVIEYASTVSVPDVRRGEQMKLYPNPSENQLKISVPLLVNSQLTVHDSQGKLMVDQNIQNKGSEFILNTSQWVSGVYFVQIKTEKGDFLKSEFVVK